MPPNAQTEMFPHWCELESFVKLRFTAWKHGRFAILTIAEHRKNSIPDFACQEDIKMCMTLYVLLQQ